MTVVTVAVAFVYTEYMERSGRQVDAQDLKSRCEYLFLSYWLFSGFLLFCFPADVL